jgi:hypothetical protein
MGNENDLIRRGDAIAVAHTARENRQAIARGITALPAAPMGVSVETVAAALWRAEAVDSGTPQSVIEGRTLEVFLDQSPDLQAQWGKFAKAAISALAAVQTKGGE